jgi:hypothetical protein
MQERIKRRDCGRASASDEARVGITPAHGASIHMLREDAVRIEAERNRERHRLEVWIRHLVIRVVEPFMHRP